MACLWYDDQEFWRKVFQDKANFFGTGFEQLGVTLNWSYPIRMNIDGKPVMRPWISDYAKPAFGPVTKPTGRQSSRR